jgi:hypothetical protein
VLARGVVLRPNYGAVTIPVALKSAPLQAQRAMPETPERKCGDGCARVMTVPTLGVNPPARRVITAGSL